MILWFNQITWLTDEVVIALVEEMSTVYDVRSLGSGENQVIFKDDDYCQESPGWIVWCSVQGKY